MGYASQLGTFSVTIKKKFYSLTLPIFICSILSGLCSIVVFGFFFTEAGGGSGPPPASPFESPYLTALMYVGIAFIGATGIFLIFKYGNIKLLRALFAVAIALTSFFFIFLFILTSPYYLLDLLTDNHVFAPSTEKIILSLAVIFGIAYSAFTVVSMVYRLVPDPLPQIMAMLFAVFAGTFLATFLPPLASVLVMIGLSVYDIISVFKGPIKKIAELSEERYRAEMANNTQPVDSNETIDKLIEASTSSDNIDNETTPTNGETSNSRLSDNEEEYIYTDYIELGLGDLAFFGMIVSFSLLYLGFYAAIASFVGVIIGAICTIKLLDKVKMMPGLPLSIGLGLVLAFIVWGILAIIGFEGWGYNMPNWFGF
ncbi:MAG: hypothetical protein FK734_06500 [Asgard group archaeon]|nr:hypothetical protein [Asgard group archaeon]